MFSFKANSLNNKLMLIHPNKKFMISKLKQNISFNKKNVYLC